MMGGFISLLLGLLHTILTRKDALRMTSGMQLCRYSLQVSK
jgi:hypothetical protein